MAFSGEIPEKLEEALYDVVAEEIERGEIKRGLWLKAVVDSGSDDLRAKARYARLRVHQLARECIEQARAEQAEKAAKEAELARQSCPYCKTYVGLAAGVCPKCNRILPKER